MLKFWQQARPTSKVKNCGQLTSFSSVIPLALFSQDQDQYKNNGWSLLLWEHPGDWRWDYSHILHHYVLVGHKPVNPIVSPFPPVLGCAVIKQQGGSLLEGQFSGRSPDIVKFGYGFYWLTFYKEHMRKRWETGLLGRHNTLSERSRWGLRNKRGHFNIQTEQGNKQIIKAGEKEAVKRDTEKHSLAVIGFSGKEKLNSRA